MNLELDQLYQAGKRREIPFPKKVSQSQSAADLEWKQLNNGGKGRRLVTRLRSLPLFSKAGRQAQTDGTGFQW